MKARPFDLSIVTGRQLASFERKVERSGDCWLWTGSTTRYGYGQFGVGVRENRTARKVRAHRLAWQLAHPEEPLGWMYVLHSCDTPACCRPDHLFLGMQIDNIRDMTRKGRQRRGDGFRRSGLTEGDIPVIRASKKTLVALAAHYDVSTASIWKIRSRKTWSHVK